MNLESFLWYISVFVIALVSLYTFYAFFSGEMTPFGAFTVLLVTYAVFGFMLGVASHLGAQRKSGWVPREEERRLDGVRPGPLRRGSSIPGHPQKVTRFAAHKKLLLALIAAGILLIAFLNPALGLTVMCISAVSYAVLRAVELFEEPEA